MLRAGERFLDIGAGWGGLLLWAAEHYGVRATGITLSQEPARPRQPADRRARPARPGEMGLLDYRELAEERALRQDRLGRHVRARRPGATCPTYFAKIRRLLKPGGLLMNHGITAGGTRNEQLGAGIGDFIERYIFPGGELMHVSHVLRDDGRAGLEALDVENLRPHYARTLWAWSDALEARLAHARQVTGEQGACAPTACTWPAAR